MTKAAVGDGQFGMQFTVRDQIEDFRALQTVVLSGHDPHLKSIEVTFRIVFNINLYCKRKIIVVLLPRFKIQSSFLIPI